MARRLDHERINRIEKTRFHASTTALQRPSHRPTRAERSPTDQDQIEAERAWKHFKAHGDLRMAQRLSDSLPCELKYKFLAWMKITTPVKIILKSGSVSKISKDKSRAVCERIFDEDAAFRLPFWLFVNDR